MTSTETTQPEPTTGQLDLPVRVHFLGPVMLHLASGSVFGDTRACGYGTEVDVTEELLRANDDRNGQSWLRTWLLSGNDTHSSGGQELVRRGPWPEDASRLQPGSFEWEDARDRDVKAAHQIDDPAERAARRQWVQDFYGAAPTTSSTLFTEPGQASR
ncbi:hypothetical protein [Modestobacter sp. Leaf380]|uniref:hypothetical protein n=1 Tax=Modestobacter sp. Leaf380 TaxID=1736356 RepID=UPI0006F33747|nr:hypothetical protein [Modestobacter sp. Leaf380]KQS66160.1 hypothetical protein ASG41_12490 [Modestobacter sp. Leaf380]